jgi:hypothetical protein
MVIGVDLLISEFSSKDLDGSVSNNFVGIHIGLSARACLPDNKGEVVVEFALNDFICSGNDSICDFWRKSITLVDDGSTLLEDTKGSDNWCGHPVSVASDIKVLK